MKYPALKRRNPVRNIFWGTFPVKFNPKPSRFSLSGFYIHLCENQKEKAQQNFVLLSLNSYSFL